ncbi:MAG: hypothetical protein VYC39_07745 [Myxococcota bacterium]|nr:hypothetical protein [Myxococcota bacterium]
MPVRMTQPTTPLAGSLKPHSPKAREASTSMPRSKRTSEANDRTAEAGSAWRKFTSSLSSSRALYGAAGVAALAPTMLMAPGAGDVTTRAEEPERDVTVEADTSTPVSIAADTIGDDTRRDGDEKPAFPPPGTFAERAWNRVDRNNSGSINGSEIKNYLGRVGVSAGFLGGVHNQAVSTAMKEADLNGDQKISKKEISGLIANIDFGDVLDENGHIKPELSDEAFAKIDVNASNTISSSELEKHINKALPQDSWFKSTVASAARKIGMDIFDTDRDKVISRVEFDKIVEDLQKIKASVSSD